MLCDELRAFIGMTLAEERTPQQMAAVSEHIRECPGCSAYLSDTLSMERQLSMLPPIPAGAAVKEVVMARILRETRTPAEDVNESHGESAWSLALILGLLFSSLPYYILLRNGQLLKPSWTFRLQLAEHLGYNAFSQPWPAVVLCALGASLTAAAMLWHDSRAGLAQTFRSANGQ